MSFKKTYSNIPENLKLKFLDAIIMENESLQQEFLNFIGQESKPIAGLSYNEFLEIIKSIQDYYIKNLEQVDLENPDWDAYNPPHSGYLKHWEQYQEASEQEFEQIFDAFRSKAVDKIIGQQLDELIAMLIGLYEATQDVEIIDEVGSFDDVNELLLSYHKELMDELINKISLSAISDGSITNGFGLFIAYADEEYPGNEFFPINFEPLLKALATKSENAVQLLSMIGNSGMEKASVAELTLLLNKKAGNTEEWLQHAQKFYRTNKEVGGELLSHYFANNKETFAKTARELFSMDEYYWARFLEDIITVQTDRKLFVDVFYRLTIHEKEIEYYQKIREYLDTKALETLLTEIDYDRSFVVNILEVEERYDDIRQIVEQNANDWDYPELIRPILTIYPEFCFHHIKTKAIITIDTQRGRSTYNRVASWLQLADLIPGYKPENRILARELYNHKPNLPALRDELRKAGLV